MPTDADALNDRLSAANTAILAEFAAPLAVEPFIGNADLNKRRIRGADAMLPPFPDLYFPVPMFAPLREEQP